MNCKLFSTALLDQLMIPFALDDCIVTRLYMYYSLRNLEFRDFHLIHDLAGIQLDDLAI